MARMPAIALLAGLLAALASPAASCGTPEATCPVDGGFYRLALPEGADPAAGSVPAVFHLHGWGQSSALAMGDGGLRAEVTARGWAFVAPEGVPSPGRTQKDWAVPDFTPPPRDDLAFFRAILADLEGRGIDTSAVLLTGFSRGGSFVWTVACEAPGLFRAYAPLSGVFWLPMPEACRGPVDLHHAHGWTDRVVPIEGRSIGGGRVIQGDLFESVAILRRAMGCPRLADETALDGDAALWRRSWTSCAEGGRIDLVLHPGGHGAYDGWRAEILDWFAARLAEGQGPMACAGRTAAAC